MKTRNPVLLTAMAATLMAGALTLLGPTAAQAAGYTVISNLDTAPGTCATLMVGTLRDCINAANSSGGTNTITFASTVTGPITVGSELQITGSQTLTITGNGEANTIVDGGGTTRVFEIESNATVTMTGITVQNGAFANNASGFTGGAGIKDSGTLTLDHVTITNSHATSTGSFATSGGILISGHHAVAIRNSTITGNSSISDVDAAGGGLQVCCDGNPDVVITDSIFSDNVASNTGADTNGSFGGAIANNNANLTITRSTFNDNSTTQTATTTNNGTGGAAILSHARVTIDQSTFHHNVSTATAVDSNAAGAIEICCGDRTEVLTVTNSTFDHNGAAGGIRPAGGAIYVCCGSSLAISTSTFDSNSSTAGSAARSNAIGGAIAFTSQVAGRGEMAIVDSTFTGNSATATTSLGGAISAESGSEGNSRVLGLALINDTIDGNAAQKGANIGITDNLVLRLQNTIVSGSQSNNCAAQNGATIADSGHNLDDGTISTCGLSAVNGDVLGADAKLGPLADNGGPTRTQALLAGSPAIDAASNAGCRATDQRGFTRFPTGDATCDIGAFEVQPAVIVATQPVVTPPTLPKAGAAPGPARPRLAILMLLALAAAAGAVGLNRRPEPPV